MGTRLRSRRWGQECGQLAEKCAALSAKEESQQNVHRKWEYSMLESFQQYQNSGRARLDSFCAAFDYWHEHSGMKLGYMQRRLIQTVTIAFLRKMFGDDLLPNLNYISQRYAIDELNDTVAILFPRRSGKTVGMAIIIAVIAVSQPHGNSIMYNLTAGQAEEFLAETIKHLNVFKDSPEFGWEEDKKDVRKMIRIRTRKFGTLNSVKSYPSALKGDGKIDFRCDCLRAPSRLNFSSPWAAAGRWWVGARDSFFFSSFIHLQKRLQVMYNSLRIPRYCSPPTDRTARTRARPT